ncbi:hypothetical protein DD556_12405 [Phaeobacter sp. JL2872]|nr:hypothetical protein DD556_12405 [Phaeobacter sp. JL2872]
MLLPEFLYNPAIDSLRAWREIEELGRAIPKRDKLADTVGLGPVCPNQPARLVAIYSVFVSPDKLLGPVVAPQLS